MRHRSPLLGLILIFIFIALLARASE